MNSRAMRSLIVSAVAATAILGGGSAALAAPSAHAAGLASATSTVRDLGAAVPQAAGPWTYYSNYPTHTACNGAGDWLKQHKNIYDFKCVEREGYGGAYTVWNLYFRII